MILKYERIENYFTALPEDDDTAFVVLAITDEGLEIKRDDTEVRTDDEGNEYPPFPGFEVSFSLKEAMKLRDFLNFALPINDV